MAHQPHIWRIRTLALVALVTSVAVTGRGGAAVPVRAAPAAAGCGAKTVAVVQGVQGEVEARVGKGKWSREKKGQAFKANEEVRTSANSEVALRACAGGSVYINERSDAMLQSRTSTRVKTGEVDSVLTTSREQVASQQVKTIASGNHALNVDVQTRGSQTVVTTVQGTAKVSAQRGSITLPADAQTRVAQNQAPAKPVSVNAAALTTWTAPFTWTVVAQLGDAQPTDLAVDPQGNIYVTEEFQGHVLKLSPQGRVLATWGTQGSGQGQFEHPMGIALDAGGNIYVADAARNQIVKLAPSGQEIAAWGTYGSDPGTFNTPEDVAVDGNGNIYVADTGNERVQKLSPNGDPLAAWGTEGFDLGQFRGPDGISLDTSGNIYVSDWGDIYNTDRLVKLTSDGRFLAQWGGQRGSGIGQFDTPEDLVVGARDDVYVAEGGNARIQDISSSDGHSLGILGTHGDGPGQFQFGEPHGLALDSHGNLYVAEEDTHRIERYSPGI